MPNTEEINILSELSVSQKEAVISEHKRTLVLAGAGAGKTKILIQKILYLISEKEIDPRNILAITFTKNAANEMIDRLILHADKEGTYTAVIKDKTISQKVKESERRKYIRKYPWLSNITIRTFHSFCYSLLRKYGAQTFDNRFKILSEVMRDEEVDTELKATETQKEIFQKIIKNLCENAEYLLKLKRYILDYYIDNYRKRKNLQGYTEYSKPYTTLGGEQVRSKSERYIADWLYLHQIEYVYEPVIILKDFPFKPDFYLPQADAYLEHVSNISQNIKEKEEQFHVANKLLIKTYEPMTKDIGIFYEALARSILPRVSQNIKKEVALNVESEFKAYFKQLDEFVSLVRTVMDKLKVEHRNIEEVCLKAKEDPHDRVKIFYELAYPLIKEYREYCIKRSYLDFNDLIILTLQLLEQNKEIREILQHTFKYLLVDEFQDVNTLQIGLLKTLLTEQAQLFCVGDDWQSIYSWRGSEVDYILNFKSHFGDSQNIKLDVNYRSNESIVRASNEVIKHNTYKIDKEIRSLKKEGKKIYLYCAQKEAEDGVQKVTEAILHFLKQGYRKEDILVLYRKTKAIEPYRDTLRGLATLRTIHAAKGLEAKIVFVVGMTGGINGFPQVWESDRILQIIKSSNIKLLLEEERRLFYVALTRAQEELFLVSELGNESSFIKEIPAELLDRNNFFAVHSARTKKYCRQCKKYLEEQFVFCPYCSADTREKEV